MEQHFWVRQMGNNIRLIICKDNSPVSKDTIPCGEDVKEVLNYLTSQTIGNLIEQHNELLIFPEKLSDETAQSTILESYYNKENVSKIKTTNIMGVISYFEERKQKKPITISIGSRFDSSEKQNFFIYLLSHVFDFNIVDWKPQTDQTKLWGLLLVFLFVHRLEKAYHQGIFKQYVQKKYIEYNFKGALDIQTHIKRNIPFAGKVAYKFREMSYDNPVLHLIRYTIDYVHNKHGNLWRGILANKWTVNEAVRVIKEATPSYTPQNRLKIYQTSLKPIRHPFYTEYDKLRNICMRILRDEGLNVYSGAEDRVYGILFDGAWLWECYIAKLLKPLGFKHLGRYQPDKAEIFAFHKDSKGEYPLYPDFYNEERFLIFDAKYKRWDEKNEEDKRGDIHQILAYMYVTQAKAGGIIFPKPIDKTIDIKTEECKCVWGAEKPFYEITFYIPKTDDDKFLQEIKDRENDFQKKLESISQSSVKGLLLTGSG